MNLRDYLRRHDENDDTPYLLGGIVEVLAIVIFSIFGLATIGNYLLGSESLASVVSAVLVDLTNGDRGSRSLGGLTVSPELTTAAKAKADDMAAKGYFAHVSPTGENSWHWFRQAGYSFLYAGENLAVDFSDSVDVERAWMNSPTHRENILNNNFTQIGIATAEGVYQGRRTVFVVQMFGTPAAKAAAPIRIIASPAEPTSTTVAVSTTDGESVLGTEADSILTPSTSWWQRVVASPRTMLQYAYYALAAIILALLVYVTELEFHKRHMRHLAAIAILFVLMIGLLTLSDILLFARPILASG